MNNDIQNVPTKMVSMWQAFKLFWKNYVNFKGKSRRSEYWWWYLWNTIFKIIISLPLYSVTPKIIKIATTNDVGSQVGSIIGPLLISLILMITYGLATLLPNIALLLRRLRDVGLPEGATIALVVAHYVVDILGLLMAPLYFVNIVILVITILPSEFKKN